MMVAENHEEKPDDNFLLGSGTGMLAGAGATSSSDESNPCTERPSIITSPANSVNTLGTTAAVDDATSNNTNSNTTAPATSVTISVEMDTDDTDAVDGRPPAPSGGGELRDRLTMFGYSQRRLGRRGRGGPQRGGFMVTGLRGLQTRHGQWTCFFCCHVTTGTAIIGAWHMLLHLLALSLLSVALVYPGLLEAPGGGGGGGRGGMAGLRRETGGMNPYTNDDYYMLTRHQQDVQAVNCTRMPCLLATQHSKSNYPHVAPDFPLALGHLLSTHQLNSEAISVAVFITLCTMLVTLLLLYGVRKQQPSQVMPFFFLQVFDFCVSSMTMLSYLSYLPNLRQLLHELPAFPFRDQLLAMQTNCLTFFVMLIFVATFIVKAYCISIVWRCYKYLLVCRAAAVTGHSTATLLAAAAAGASTTAATGRSGADGGRSSNSPPADHCMLDYRSKLPGMYPEPPPSYDMAMAAFPTPAPGDPPYPAQGGVAANGGPDARRLADDDSPLLPRYEDAVQQGDHTYHAPPPPPQNV